MFDPQILCGDIQRRAYRCDGREDSKLLIPQVQGKRNRRVVEMFHQVAFPTLWNTVQGQGMLQQPVGLVPEGAGKVFMVDALQHVTCDVFPIAHEGLHALVIQQ